MKSLRSPMGLSATTEGSAPGVVTDRNDVVDGVDNRALGRGVTVMISTERHRVLMAFRWVLGSWLDDGFGGKECGGSGGETLGGEDGDTDGVAGAFGDRVPDL